jgi:hypothetical protein
MKIGKKKGRVLRMVAIWLAVGAVGGAVYGSLRQFGVNKAAAGAAQGAALATTAVASYKSKKVSSWINGPA